MCMCKECYWMILWKRSQYCIFVCANTKAVHTISKKHLQISLPMYMKEASPVVCPSLRQWGNV